MQIMFQRNEEKISLTEFEGINILGDLIESSILSVNAEFYGNLHNMGHVFLSLIHDPEHKYLVSIKTLHDDYKKMYYHS